MRQIRPMPPRLFLKKIQALSNHFRSGHLSPRRRRILTKRHLTLELPGDQWVNPLGTVVQPCFELIFVDETLDHVIKTLGPHQGLLSVQPTSQVPPLGGSATLILRRVGVAQPVVVRGKVVGHLYNGFLLSCPDQGPLLRGIHELFEGKGLSHPPKATLGSGGVG